MCRSCCDTLQVVTKRIFMLGSDDGGVSQGMHLTRAGTAAEPRHAAGQDAVETPSQTSSIESELTEVSTVAKFFRATATLQVTCACCSKHLLCT